MTIIATAIGTTMLAVLPETVGATLGGLGIGAFGVGATTIGAAGALGMGIDSAISGGQAKTADKKQGAANAAISGAVAPAAASVHSAPTTPISTGGQQYFATGGLTSLAKGGRSVRLEDSDYIVPADVVSALGNGSTKAGAKYLTHLCNAIHAGPPPKAGSLAKQRAKERYTA